ncbi:unnamed protein product [Calypogeia fissa]
MMIDQGGGGLHSAALDAFAGAVAGGVSRTLVSPLDVIKIRFQVQLEPTSRRSRPLDPSQLASKYTGIWQATKSIVREEGITGLWRGNVPALLLVMPYTAIQFVVLQKFKDMAAKYGTVGGELSPGWHFVSGSVAGAAATIGSYPFDLLRTIMASQGEPKVYSSMREASMGIIRTRGIRGLYAGLVPSLVEIVPYAGLQFGSYETFKRWTKVWVKANGLENRVESKTLSSLEHFICGLGAGTFAKICCHPLDVVKKRFQVEGLQRDLKYGARIKQKAYKGMADAVSTIFKEEGWRGLYKGTLPSVVKAAPASAITFVVYEKVRQLGLNYLDESTNTSQ